MEGKKLAATLQVQLIEKVKTLKTTPSLCVILIGEDPASKIYVAHKQKACQAVGIAVQLIKLPSTTSESVLLSRIDELNQDDSQHGILVQLPLPKSINTLTILKKINPHKDVDGFHPINIGLLAQGQPHFQPCTPLGILQLIDHYDIPVKGKHAVIVGASLIVGKPMALQLLDRDATVSICHKETKNLATMVAQADILVSAVGIPNLIKGDWIKPGSALFDVGITRLKDNTIAGDIEFTKAKEKATWITPVPGGVGPMTVAMLMRNTVMACENTYSLEANTHR
jgi:methylenetetrahydrofolate dehydrogenase (NADP+)/methenyltetrahydrofolate cyclohydrolase